MTEPIRIILADDHPLIREGIRTILAAAPDLVVVGKPLMGRRRYTSARN
jgi:DNA-binding NarL/FixJ family response regulator